MFIFSREEDTEGKYIEFDFNNRETYVKSKLELYLHPYRMDGDKIKFCIVDVGSTLWNIFALLKTESSDGEYDDERHYGCSSEGCSITHDLLILCEDDDRYYLVSYGLLLTNGTCDGYEFDSIEIDTRTVGKELKFTENLRKICTRLIEIADNADNEDPLQALLDYNNDRINL